MAKIILNTNLANESFVVEYKSIEVDINKVLTKKEETVYITPNRGSVINANDFTHGTLPNLINTIKFSNTNAIIDSSNKVVATVYFNPLKITKKNNLIFLPISGKTKSLENNFRLIETCPSSEYLLKRERNYFKTESSSVDGKAVIKHNVKGKPNETVLIFQKGLTLQDGYRFSKEPSFTIKGSLKNYTMRKNPIKNKQNQIIGEIFNLYFTFPSFEYDKRRDDTIDFVYNVVPIEKPQSEYVNEEIDTKENNIYGIDTGRSIGPEGGEKRLRVTGVPGSTFKLLVQNNSKQIYNFETGLFETGAPLYSGEIPEANKGVGYGELKFVVEVPPSTSGDDIIVSMIADNYIDHTELSKYYDTVEKAVQGDQINEIKRISTKSEEKVTQIGSFTFTVKNGGETGFVISRPVLYSDNVDNVDNYLFGETHLKDGTYKVGDGTGLISTWIEDNPIIDYNKNILRYLTWTISTDADNKFIRINRQPRIGLEDVSYIRWDSAHDGEDVKDRDSSGNFIYNDFGDVADDGTGSTLDFLGGSFSKSKISAVGVGDAVEHGVTNPNDEEGLAYSTVVITLDLEGEFGKGAVAPDLNLKNFLTIHTL